MPKRKCGLCEQFSLEIDDYWPDYMRFSFLSDVSREMEIWLTSLSWGKVRKEGGQISRGTFSPMGVGGKIMK